MQKKKVASGHLNTFFFIIEKNLQLKIAKNLYRNRKTAVIVTYACRKLQLGCYSQNSYFDYDEDANDDADDIENCYDAKHN